jgi:hypothetical protein
MLNLLRWCLLLIWKPQPPLSTAMGISKEPVQQANITAPGQCPSKGTRQQIELRRLAQVTEDSGKKQVFKGVAVE